MFQKPLVPSKIEWLILVVHLICLTIGIGTVGFLLISGLFAYAVLKIFSSDYRPFFLLLLLGSYHSMFDNVYTTGIFGLKYIYPLVGLYLFSAVRFIKINRATLYILAPLAILFLVHMVLGLFYMYSLGWYFNELISFVFFIGMAITIATGKKRSVNTVLRVIANYVLYFYPLLTLVSIITAREENLFFDEFEKFYFIAIIPLILTKAPNKFLLLLLHVAVFVLKAKYTYTSSLNIILVAISVVVLFVFSNISLTKKLVLTVVSILGAFVVYQYSSDLTKFKLYQAHTAVAEISDGNVLAIPKSPRVRVVEVMISYENLKRQGLFFMLFGKGYGSYLDDSRTNYFKKYAISLKPEDYSDEEVERKQYKKGHGGIPYLPIKTGAIGLIYFIFLSGVAFSLIKSKDFIWLGITVPFYIMTTFSYGMKNFIFVGAVIGLALAIRYKHGFKL